MPDMSRQAAHRLIVYFVVSLRTPEIESVTTGCCGPQSVYTPWIRTTTASETPAIPMLFIATEYCIGLYSGGIWRYCASELPPRWISQPAIRRIMYESVRDY